MNLISSNQAEIDIKKFKKIKRISKGGFGVFYTVEEKETGKLFAAKIIDCDDDEKICDQMIKREITIMMYARHPTIIKFIGYSKHDFQDENNITIIMELAKNGSLKNVLKKIQDGDGPKDYTNISRQIILVGVARGMKFLHDRSIIHRDLKTDNILLDEEFHPHITDFGLSKFIESGHTRSQTKFGGTLPYEAPEILQGLKYDQKVDVYAFAILMFEVLTDSVPYPELEKEEFNAFKFTSKIIKKNYRPKITVPVKKSFKKLIERCWSANPDDRPDFGEIFTLLSNTNVQRDDEEDFMLDDVDTDELNLYIEDISEVTDSTEKLLNKISKKDAEIKQLKDENKNLKSEIKRKNETIDEFEDEIKKLKAENRKLRKKIDKLQEDKKKHKKEVDDTKVASQRNAEIHNNKKRECRLESIIVGGWDENNGLGEKPNNKTKNGGPIIYPPVKLSFDPSSLLSYSTFGEHAVMVKSDGSLKAIGNNQDGRISSILQRTVFDDFTDFSIKDRNGRQLVAISAVCCSFSTLYMFSKSRGDGRQLVLCDFYINKGEPIFLDIGNHHPVSLFGGDEYSAAICSEGEVIFINRDSINNSPNSPIKAAYLPDGEKASSVACCLNSVFVLSSNGRVFSSPIKNDDDEDESSIIKFSIVSELLGNEIVCLSGPYYHVLAVSKDGRVFGFGRNECGELGFGKKTKKVSKFTLISSLADYEISAAYAGCEHSFFETREGKIFACGDNYCGELFLSSGPGENVYSPTETTITRGVAFCIVGDGSVFLIGSSPPPNTPNMTIKQWE